MTVLLPLCTGIGRSTLENRLDGLESEAEVLTDKVGSAAKRCEVC